jgi:hypothetical protein
VPKLDAGLWQGISLAELGSSSVGWPGGISPPGSHRGTVASAGYEVGQAGLMRRHPARVPVPRSGFAGFRFPADVIMVAVGWYLRYGLSYRDVEELLAERGIEVDRVKSRSYTTLWPAEIHMGAEGKSVG